MFLAAGPFMLELFAFKTPHRWAALYNSFAGVLHCRFCFVVPGVFTMKLGFVQVRF